MLFNEHYPSGLGFELQPWNRINLEASRFDPALETKIIVPGWLDNLKRALWVRHLKDALLFSWHKPINIIVVHWTNFTPYTIATANTRVVGAELANLLKFIETESNYDRSYYHLIGHSLGAHISGYCGDRLPGLGRITALDPARPFFQHMPKSVRLDRADAKFVDAIHSDFTPENAIFLIMSYGMTTPVGHLDFYPNGPPLLQSGCLRDTILSIQNGLAKGIRYSSISVAFLESIRYLTACDHQRSHQWFIESILNRECLFVGVRCNEYEGLINGRCTCDNSKSACAIMGIHADQMYLNNVHEDMFPLKNRRPILSHLNHVEQLGPQLSAMVLPKDFIYSQLKHEAALLRRPPIPEPIMEFEDGEDVGLVEGLDDSLASIRNDVIFFNYLRGLQTVNTQRRQDNLEPDVRHPLEMMSDMDRDIETWYEENSRWYLKTANKENFCVNQYQVLIFIGPLKTSNGHEHLKANLILSIVGSRGQILNQRFKPRSLRLESNTMQPFFIILEGSYSLGEIKSIAIGWEQQIEFEPVQASVSFESNLLQQMEPLMLTYKARHPWLSETLKYDYTNAFRWNEMYFKYPQIMSRIKRSSAQPVTFMDNNCSEEDSTAGQCSKISERRAGKDSLSKERSDDLIDNSDEGEVLDGQRGNDDDHVGGNFILPPVVQISGQLDESSHDLIPEPSLISHKSITSQGNEIIDDVNLKLHNVGIHNLQYEVDSIVINQVIVSPVQAHYGKYGAKRMAKTFCPPKLNYKLYQEQTVRLVPNIMNSCYFRRGHRYERL